MVENVVSSSYNRFRLHIKRYRAAEISQLSLKVESNRVCASATWWLPPGYPLSEYVPTIP